MDPLQNDIWAHLGHAPDEAPAADGPVAAAPPTPDAVAATGTTRDATAVQAAAEPVDQRATSTVRRRFDRGGRRRSDWPEDAGLTCCPGCGFERIQSLGALDSGDYLWQCPQCDRRFQTGRATRTML
jgi:hypothetical protein